MHYGLLETLESNPGLSQRDLAKRLGVSLGKVSFCLRALIEQGRLKVRNFRNSENKRRTMRECEQLPAEPERKVRARGLAEGYI